jgi:hypothetical protein
MEAVELKLKQASAVLGVAPKDLQNLVQFKVLRPARRDSMYWFNNRLLLEAKIALYLKDSLGISTDVLTLFGRALSSLSDERVTKARYLSLRSRTAKGREPIEVRIPVRELVNELNEQLPTAVVYQDLPRGRKRSGWKREFTRALQAAAKDLSGVTESQIADAIRGFRAGKKTLPEITIGPSSKTA